jgi:hypothetical protein
MRKTLAAMMRGRKRQAKALRQPKFGRGGKPSLPQKSRMSKGMSKYWARMTEEERSKEIKRRQQVTRLRSQEERDE